jgi:GntR family transcriptional repressor for pyruvate dehydrogenase complex
MRRFFELASYIGTSPLQLIQLRVALEPRAAALAASERHQADLAAMEQAIQVMASAGSDVDQFVAGDMRFHEAVVLATHNPFFSVIVLGLSSSLQEERAQGVRERVRRGLTNAQSVRDHQRILAAIVEQDPVLAAALMLEHVEGGLKYFRGYSKRELSRLRG